MPVTPDMKADMKTAADGLRAELAYLKKTFPADRLDPRIKELWVKALRSGKFAQGQGRLCAVLLRGQEPSFCCLGVLANEDISDEWTPSVEGSAIMKKDGSRTALSDRYREKIGLGLTSHNALAEANDDGVDFASIADAIESGM